MDKRIFVSKKQGFQTEAEDLRKDLIQALHLDEDLKLKSYNVYDLFNIEDKDLKLLEEHILAEPVSDEVFEELDLDGQLALAYEFLPGQYDQRADGAIQCLQLLNPGQNARIHSGTLLVFENLQPEKLEEIEKYLINPVESRKKDLNKLDDTLDLEVKSIPVLKDFRELNETDLKNLYDSLGLAMSLADFAFIQDHFKDIDRDPTLTEIRVLDTYWSDHCRHTTFETVFETPEFDSQKFNDSLKESYQEYLNLRRETGRAEKPQTLMDLATIAARALKKRGILNDQEVSDENNACSIEVDVDHNGEIERWLVMFKNETHNHPTEIEPFGGASTCLGGAIRDPLSGRSYVYQAMRITGAGDINKPVEETLPHKLPQSKISKVAAAGYSSYGNQIGLPTTFVQEIFDEGYEAKRMEVGAVVGAAKKENVRREKPEAGDLIILVGGATGRDGIGGATGSSKEHTEESLESCGSEVQKGNAPMERRLQRFFKNPEVSKLIKKANDFGAGGVSVAVGELADGLDIDLDQVHVKYEGLDGTELAISESQERMACVIEPESLETFQKLAREENLESYLIAKVTDSNHLKMKWKDDVIVDLDRDFLNTNGVRSKTSIKVEDLNGKNPFKPDHRSLGEILSGYNSASQIGLAEMFDASIGKTTVLMPFGGARQLTPEQGSVQKLPVDGFTTTCTAMTFGYDPSIFRYSPYLGAQYSVVEALSKLAALGFNPLKARLTNQEYFKKLKTESDWGLPFQSLLGLLKAQLAFETPSIGGKDSMSGTFENLNVPPTLITFAVSTGKNDKVHGSAFKKGEYPIYLLPHQPKDEQPDYAQLKSNYESLFNAEGVLAARAVLTEGIRAAVAKMAFGNWVGATVDYENLDDFQNGAIIVQLEKEPDDTNGWIKIGSTVNEPVLTLNGTETTLENALKAWTKTFDDIYPRSVEAKAGNDFAKTADHQGSRQYSKVKVEHPKVLIPVFPGQNCEIDLSKKFERAGAEVKMEVFNNLSAVELEQSIDKLAREIEDSQIFMLAGGFSLADEPDGSGKFIASVLNNPKIKESLKKFRENDGLILGICNGFQALVKSGLLLEGMDEAETATLFKNDINRHVSHVSSTRIASNKSPWLQDYQAGEIFEIPVSHGEGKFMASEALLKALNENGQIATQYVDAQGNPTMDGEFNPNGSFMAIEGVLSKDGRIFGKMGHSERYEPGLLINIEGNKDQDIFTSGVRFFTHEGK